MRDPKEKIQSAEPLPPRPYVEPRSMGDVFKKNGVYDGKIFCSADKVTYTFLADQDVISLHFDKNRQTIFYKGHNINNHSLNQKERAYLQRFQSALEKEPEAAHFIAPYTEALMTYLKDNPA